jgi:hypothetical protein
MDTRFEIREYIDENGVLVKDEMVDIDAEMKGFHSFFEQQKATLAEDKKESFEKLMSKLSAMTTEPSGDEDNVRLLVLRLLV